MLHRMLHRMLHNKQAIIIVLYDDKAIQIRRTLNDGSSFTKTYKSLTDSSISRLGKLLAKCPSKFYSKYDFTHYYWAYPSYFKPSLI